MNQLLCSSIFREMPRICHVLLLVLSRADAHARYLIVRHGQTDQNAAGVLQGSSDSSRLTEKGVAQAREAGAELMYLSDLQFTHVYVSPLARAQQTLSLLTEAAEAHPVPTALPPATVLPELREIDLYSWEGQPKEAIAAASPGAYQAWKSDPLGLTIDGHRPVVELWDRARDSWGLMRSAATDDDAGGGAALVVCHNQVGKALLCTAFGLDETHLRTFEFPNCGAVELEWQVSAKHAARWRWRLPLTEESGWKDETEL